jgi:UDP-N-acetylglucosamine--N-acetylmuramyl-(pentapeptide) pyrophosphoryl-undecaprenol N-acetylglucosamine transferase
VTRVLLGVSPIGLGHATRAIVILQELKRNGAEVRVFSGGKAADFLRRNGVEVDRIVDDPVPRVVNGEMSRVSLWYVRSWLAHRRNIPRTRRLIAAYRPDIVVCDEEFSGVIVAGELGIKRILVSDELELGFARTWLARKIEQRVGRWYVGLQNSVDRLLIPETGTDEGNRVYVGPIVRERIRSCPEVRTDFGLPNGRMVLLALSGSGLGRELAQKLLEALKSPGLDGSFLAVVGNRDEKMNADGVYDLGVVTDNQDLVACADVVVSLAGKSTIDEARAAGTPIVTIPIRYHAEQERNASALGFTSADATRLAELVKERIGKRVAPLSFDGEAKAVRTILSLAPSS